MRLIKNKRIILIISTLLFILFAFFGWNYVITSPQYSLYKMYGAVEARDYNTFSKYVDVNSIIDTAVDKALEEANSKSISDSPDDVWGEFGKSLAEGLIALMKPKLKEEAKTQIKRQIESGEFKKDYQPKNIVSAFTKIKVKIEGKGADVTLTNDSSNELKFKMRRLDDHWQVFEMDFKLENQNNESKDAQHSSKWTPASTKQDVELKILEKNFNESDWGLEDQITMKFEFKNNTTKPVKAVKGTLTFYDTFGDKITSTSIKHDKGIPALGTAIYEAGLEYNQFKDSDKQLKNISLGNLKYKWEMEQTINE